MKNRQTIARIINGIDFDVAPSAWMTEQINAGLLDVVVEFTITMGALPADIALLDGGFTFYGIFGGSYTASEVSRGYVSRFVDSEGNPVNGMTYDVGFGESVTVQLTTFTSDSFPFTGWGSWQATGNINAEVIPEPGISVLLLGVGGLWVASRLHWRRRREKSACDACLAK